MDAELMTKGLQVAIFGLGGVFTVLILFYLATRALLQYAKRSGSNKGKTT